MAAANVAISIEGDPLSLLRESSYELMRTDFEIAVMSGVLLLLVGLLSLLRGKFARFVPVPLSVIFLAALPGSYVDVNCLDSDNPALAETEQCDAQSKSDADFPLATIDLRPSVVRNSTTSHILEEQAAPSPRSRNNFLLRGPPAI
ncbi:hypothetical protein [Blastopirellula marina]|uniref:Uncharacterized protein n=1 Tax=Blastopirellula marina DSM 3645 TaxID=314230 RepID=A3ZX06_9BACT|nr:hypothetical protein [Blastopirellula marina]EAQ78883.1 hypothetical protein DSM3645_27423 [Blastopirellula marina DSM 3645]